MPASTSQRPSRRRPRNPLAPHASGALSGTNQAQLLRDRGIETLLIAGMAVDRGCNTTARQALNRGLRVVMVCGACYTHDIARFTFRPIGKDDVERVHLAAPLSHGREGAHDRGDWLQLVKNGEPCEVVSASQPSTVSLRD